MKPALLEQHTATDKKTDKISVDLIITKGLQTRVATDAATVAAYAEIYKAGGTLPPIRVFLEEGKTKQDDDLLWLADGQHRVAGAKRAELDEIDAIITKGDKRAALWYAAAANAQHGLPRTNEDKRRAVGLILADEEWRQLSDVQIAEHLSVSDRLVAKVRKETGAESNTRKGKDGKTRTKPAAKAKAPSKPATTIQRELCGDGTDMDEAALPDLPPGVYLDPDENGSEYHVLISSDDQATRVLVPGAKIRTSYGTGGVIEEVLPYRISGCLVYGVSLKDHGGNINELVTWNGEIRKLFACNEDRIVVGTGPKPKQGKDDSAELAKIGKPLRPAKPADVAPTGGEIHTNLIAWPEISARLRIAVASAGISASAYAAKHKLPYLALVRTLADGAEPADEGTSDTLYDHAAALPPSTAPGRPADEIPDTDGPEEITDPQPPKPSPEVPASEPDVHPLRIPGRPLELRRVDAQRDLIAAELGKGKAKWSGTDNDLFLLGLIAGVPTRSQAWIDNSRAQARDLFIDALRSEVADRVRSGEAANTPKWPSIRELCALWSLDYASIEIRAERAVPA